MDLNTYALAFCTSWIDLKENLRLLRGPERPLRDSGSEILSLSRTCRNAFIINIIYFNIEQYNKSTLNNSPPPLLNLKLLRSQGQIIDVKCKKSQ